MHFTIKKKTFYVDRSQVFDDSGAALASAALSELVRELAGAVYCSRIHDNSLRCPLCENVDFPKPGNQGPEINSKAGQIASQLRAFAGYVRTRPAFKNDTRLNARLKSMLNAFDALQDELQS